MPGSSGSHWSWQRQTGGRPGRAVFVAAFSHSPVENSALSFAAGGRSIMGADTGSGVASHRHDVGPSTEPGQRQGRNPADKVMVMEAAGSSSTHYLPSTDVNLQQVPKFPDAEGWEIVAVIWHTQREEYVVVIKELRLIE